MTKWGKILGPVAIVLAPVLVSACGNDDTTPVVPDELAEMDADNVFFGMRQNLTAEGVRQAQVLADTAFGWRDSTAVHLRNPQMTAYYEDGRERALVTGERGRHDVRTDQLYVSGDVVLVIPETGRRLESEELHYDPQGNRIWSDEPFALHLEDRDQAITGSWFESDLGFQEFSAGGDDAEGLEDVEPVDPPEEPGTPGEEDEEPAVDSPDAPPGAPPIGSAPAPPRGTGTVHRI